MKKLLLLFLLVTGAASAQTHVGSVSNIWPHYSTEDEFNALRAEFDSLITTNSITVDYADDHYLAIMWSNAVLNAQVTASNAVPTNSAVYTNTVALANSALQYETLWISASNKVVYTNTAVYTDTVAKAASAVYTNTADYTNALALANSALQSETLWIAASNKVIYTNTAVYTDTVAKANSALQTETLWIAASNKVVYTNTDVYTNTVAKAAAAVYTNTAAYTNAVALAISALQTETLWIAASNRVIYTNTAVYTDAVAKASAAVPTNDTRYLAAVTNNQTNVTIQVVEQTVALAPATYSQLTNAIYALNVRINNLSVTEYQQYLDANTQAVALAWIIPTNQYLACTNLVAGTTNFSFTYNAEGSYGYVAYCTNTTFTNLAAGSATVIDFSYETGSGSITDKVELYAFVRGTTNQIELGDSAIPQTVPTSSGSYRIFSIPYISYNSTNPVFLGFKKKCVTKGVGSTVIQECGDGYNTHIEWGFSN